MWYSGIMHASGVCDPSSILGIPTRVNIVNEWRDEKLPCGSFVQNRKPQRCRAKRDRERHCFLVREAN